MAHLRAPRRPSLADVLPLKDPGTFDFLNVNQLPNQPIGTPGFPLGTDANSWDILSRLIYGGRVSLIVGLRRARRSAW